MPSAPSNRGYVGGFSTAMMLKDLKLSQEAARAAKVQTPLGAEATALYAEYVGNGNGPLDYSGIIRMIRELN